MTEHRYQPTASEQLRQDFVLSLKLLANGPMQRAVRQAQASRNIGSDELDAAEWNRCAAQLCGSVAFRQWAAVTHASQSMMWRAIEATVERTAPAARRRLADLLAARDTASSLELDPACVAPAPIATVEIHRQPGGYVSEQVPGDVSAGLRYLGSGLIYSPGKGNTAGAEARGAYIAAQVTQRFPALRPRRILDLGCGIGLASQGIARAFPEAEYTAIDVAAPLLRYAFLQAAERGARIQFKQRDAAHTGFVPQSYDLIVSNIMLHETSATHVPAIMRECYRLLAPAGAMLHLDVATQRARLPFADQVMNDWQVRWNGEPFWTGFASLDVRSAIEAAGFAREKVFTDYPAKDGGGAWFVFGAQK